MRTELQQTVNRNRQVVILIISCFLQPAVTVTYMSSTNLAEPPVGWPMNNFKDFYLYCLKHKNICNLSGLYDEFYETCIYYL